jgi:hypothetical protein
MRRKRPAPHAVMRFRTARTSGAAVVVVGVAMIELRLAPALRRALPRRPVRPRSRCRCRRKVSCMTKDNIMKKADGLFHEVFDEVAAECPGLATEHDIAGRGIGNPSGLLLSAVMMLVHIGQGAVATKLHNAWLRTLEDGLTTADFHGPRSGMPLSTMAFADAVARRLGRRPEQLRAVDYAEAAPWTPPPLPERRAAAVKHAVGVDVFVHDGLSTSEPLAARLHQAAALVDHGPWKLAMITNRGVKVWPGGFPETFCTDHWRCRFVGRDALGH